MNSSDNTLIYSCACIYIHIDDDMISIKHPKKKANFSYKQVVEIVGDNKGIEKGEIYETKTLCFGGSIRIESNAHRTLKDTYQIQF